MLESRDRATTAVPATSRMTGADAVIASLRVHGVSTLFGIPGIHNVPLYDAIGSETGLRHVLARHEQGAGFMAEGYARVSGEPGTVVTITGPGVTNVATPMADAYADSIPLFVISTSLPRGLAERRQGEMHEVKDQLGVMQSLAGWTRAVGRVEEIPDAIRDAFSVLASDRPRGAYLQIPYDLLEIEAEVEMLPPRPMQRSAPIPAQISEAAELLRGARKPVILAGNGVTASGANDLLAGLAMRLSAPVFLGSESRDVLPHDFPLAVPASGAALVHQGFDLRDEFDVALLVGSRQGMERTGAGKVSLPDTVVQIDIDPAQIGRRRPVTLGIVADAGTALSALLDSLDDLSEGRSIPTETIASLREGARRYARQTYGESVVMLDAVREALPRKGVIVADSTMMSYAAADYLPTYEPRTFYYPQELGTIGLGIPMAMGAKIAAPDRPVIALCGDGGVLLNISELASAVQERIPIVVVVFNDGAYTAVKVDQQERFNRQVATSLRAPDFVALARAFGVSASRAESPDELAQSIRAALALGEPVLVEVPLS